MTAGYDGPFNGLAGGGFAGWSNFCTGAGVHHTRYRDGDPVGSVVWRELYGNANYHYAQSRRLLWADSFVGAGTTSSDPTYYNAASDISTSAAIYAVNANVLLTPNIRRGARSAPQISCQLRYRKRTSGGSDHTVRVYGIGASLNQAMNAWDGTAPNVSWPVTSTIYSNSGATGFGGVLTFQPDVYWTTIDHVYASNDVVSVPCMMTTLVLAGIGEGGGHGPYIAAVEVWEEAPAA